MHSMHHTHGFVGGGGGGWGGFSSYTPSLVLRSKFQRCTKVTIVDLSVRDLIYFFLSQKKLLPPDCVFLQDLPE